MITFLKSGLKPLVALAGFFAASLPMVPVAHAQIDSIVLELPAGDICENAVKNFPIKDIKTPAAFNKVRGKMAGKVNLDFRLYAQVACQDMKNQMIDAAKAQIKSIDPRTAVDRALKTEANKVYDGFLFWLAETVREPFLASLPEEERAKFTPGTPEADAQALIWAANSGKEIEAYVSAYLHSLGKDKASGIGLGRIFDDYMSGASQGIIDGLGGIVNNGISQAKVVLGAKQEIVEHKADYVTTMRGAGLSGKWIDNLEASEVYLRKVDTEFNAVEGLQIVYRAINAEEPDEKIKGFFELIAHVGALAKDSQIPMASLIGQIVAAYADTGLQMLEALDGLEASMRLREGYCVGLGTHAGGDKRERLLADAIGQSGQQADIRICPLRAGVSPWKDIYFQDQPEPLLSTLYFYIDAKKDSRFVKGTPGNGGKGAVLEAISLINSASDNGFQAFTGKSSDIAVIAAVYNTPFQDQMGVGGILALQEDANNAISNIAAQRDRLTNRLTSGKNACAAEYVEREISIRSGLDISNFPPTTAAADIQTLKINYMAGFVEKHRDFATGTPRRSGAYDTYAPIATALENLSLLRIDAKVHEQGQRGSACTRCGGAGLKVTVQNGDQISGCEALRIGQDGSFAVHVLTDTPELIVNVKANIPGASTEDYPIDFSYLNFNAKISELPFVQTIDIDYPVKFAEPDGESGDPQAVRQAFSLANSACSQLESESAKALMLAEDWTSAVARLNASNARPEALSATEAKTKMTALAESARAALLQAEQDAAQSCNAAKDSQASFIDREAKRSELREQAKARLSALRQAGTDLQQLAVQSSEIMSARPSPGGNPAAGLVDQTYVGQARDFMVGEPMWSQSLDTTVTDTARLRGPYQRWTARNPDKAKASPFDFDGSLGELKLCQSAALSQAIRARTALDGFGVASSVAPPPISPLWTDIDAMAAEISQAHESIKGLITQTEACVGADPAPAPDDSNHGFVAQGWVGNMRLQSVYASEPSFGKFECESVSSCRAEAQKWLAAENQKTPEDAEFNTAISGAIQQYIALLFSGLQTGLIIESQGPGAFKISSGDVGFGDMTAQSVTVKRVNGDLYRGTQMINIEGTGPVKVSADMIVEGRNAINVKTYIEVDSKKAKFEVSFTSDLSPGVVNADAIKAANTAAIMSAFQ